MYTLPRRGVKRGDTPSVGSGGAIPSTGGSGGQRGYVRFFFPLKETLFYEGNVLQLWLIMNIVF
jgi:hypothetical protein